LAENRTFSLGVDMRIGREIRMRGMRIFGERIN